MRCADFGPTPGRQRKASISSSRLDGVATAQCKWRGIASSSCSGSSACTGSPSGFGYSGAPQSSQYSSGKRWSSISTSCMPASRSTASIWAGEFGGVVLVFEQRPDHAMDHVGSLALREADAVLLDLAVVIRGDYGAQIRCRHIQRGLQEGHGRAQRIRARGAVGFAHGRMEGLRQQRFERTGRQQRPQRLAALGAPLLEGFGATAVLLLPAEQRCADRCAAARRADSGCRTGSASSQPSAPGRAEIAAVQRGLGQFFGQCAVSQ